ncbi:MAG: hypothetical protein DYH13_11325 [Alphaproteobacteria bacterium PRO2]|nr:hypothetical protein [Alphaproteobacteria bacterium PRO2]
MDVTPLIREGAQVIQSYAAGSFRVSGKVYSGAIIVMPTETFSWDAPHSFYDLKAEHFKALTLPLRGPLPLPVGEGLDVVLLGTGKTMQILKPDMRAALKEMGLSVEAMDTGAACRTYNVLMAEGRRVAAALIPAI